MFQTSLICGIGLLVFMASPFAPIARFGLVMAIMLALGLIGDLVLLPATLSSTLGQKWAKKQGL
jgi:predicted RND superfamily exporter protein